MPESGPRLDQVGQGFTILGLEILQCQILHSLTGQLVPMLACPHIKKKIVKKWQGHWPFVFVLCDRTCSVLWNLKD